MMRALQMGLRRLLSLGAIVTLLAVLMSPSVISASSGVNTLGGFYFYEHTDSTFVVSGSRFAFIREYRSDYSPESRLGRGWMDNFGMHVTLVTGTEDFTVTGPQGRADRYSPDGSGGFKGRTDMNVSLTRTSDGGFIATQEDGAVWTFNAQGRLLTDQESGKAALSIVQSALGASAVIGADGHPALLFDYDSMSGRLVSVTDVPNADQEPVPPRTVRFTYDEQGRLATATDRAGAITRYTYSGDTWRLTSITDALGHVAVALSYDDRGLVVTRADARGVGNGRRDTFQYTVDASGHVSLAIQHRVPSGFAPAFDPPFTYQFETAQSMTSVLKSAPTDEPYVEVASPDTTAPKGHRITQSGGGTPKPSGSPYEVEVGRPGGAAVVVGDPDVPVPDPVCVPRASAPQDPADARLWSTGYRTFDARTDAFAGYAQAARTATGWTLDGFNRPVEMHDAHGNVWRATFDQDDRPLSALDANGAGAIVTYDLVGNVVRVERRPSGAVTTFEYDERDSLASARWPTGDLARYEYDDRGDLSRATLEPSGGSPAEVAEYAFDAFHRIRRVVQFANWPDKVGSVETNFSYDNTGGCAAYLQSEPGLVPIVVTVTPS